MRDLDYKSDTPDEIRALAERKYPDGGKMRRVYLTNKMLNKNYPYPPQGRGYVKVFRCEEII
jgi:hypothetical protein